MKLALALVLLAAPLAAQTPTDQKIVYNVVVTIVSSGSPSTTPAPGPTMPIVTPDPTPAPAPTPAPTPSPGAPTTSCAHQYADAVTAMNGVTDSLLQTQSLFTTGYQQNGMDANAYSTGNNNLAIVRLDTSDVRDLIRIAAPQDVIAQNITFVSAEIGTLPGLLGVTPQLKGSIANLVTSMQTSLGTASSLITSSSCPQAVP